MQLRNTNYQKTPSKLIFLFLIGTLLSGCQAMQQAMDDKNLRVVDASSSSVTIAGDGNAAYNREPDLDARVLARETCRKLGKDRAEYQSTRLEVEFYTNYYLFLCVGES